MTPFLKTQRNKLLKTNQLNGYLKYALGEIILVVIGILIAMYIRSEYEVHQENKKIESSALQVIDDLRNDTTVIGILLKAYQPMESDYLLILSDSLSKSQYDSCNSCAYLVSSINPFAPNQEGYSIIRTFSPKFESRIDSLLHETKSFYSNAIPAIEIIVNMLKDDVGDNLRDWKMNQAWYHQWIKGEQNAAMDEYFYKSQDYKNKVANHYLLLYKNYLTALEQYSKMATQLADDWEEALAKE